MKQRFFLDAVSFAARKHAGQWRKDGVTPYAAHPFRVASLLLTEFGVSDEEVLCTAVLHDVIEDTTADYEDISERFGERVADHVALLSHDSRLPEAERDERYLQAIAQAPVEVQLCKLGDTLDNLIDSGTLSPGARERLLRRTRRLLELVRDDFPERWKDALKRVDEELARLSDA